MTKNQFNLKQRKMLLQAQKIVNEASVNYGEILEQHIQELQKSLDSENLEEAIRVCYIIQSQAGTFGWPLATEISGWFKRILIIQQEKGLNSKANALFQNSLNIILRDDLKRESDTAVKLLIHIESELKKENLR